METLGELSKGSYVINNGWKFRMEIANFYLTGCKVLFALRKGKCNPCTLNIALVDVSSLVFALEPLKPDFSRVGIWWLDNGCFERDLAERFLCESKSGGWNWRWDCWFCAIHWTAHSPSGPVPFTQKLIEWMDPANSLRQETSIYISWSY